MRAFLSFFLCLSKLRAVTLPTADRSINYHAIKRLTLPPDSNYTVNRRIRVRCVLLAEATSEEPLLATNAPEEGDFAIVPMPTKVDTIFV